MGTRGLFGFRCDGVDRLTYNHFDSYPSCLGEKMMACIREQLLADYTLDTMRKQVRRLRLIDGDSKPSAEDIEKLQPFTDLQTSEQSTQDWYCLTRGLQGEPQLILDAGIMIDCGSFINDSLFCEWAYVVNLDDKTLEIYRGFQRQEHQLGRYAKPENDRGYYPCALFATVPLYELPHELSDALPKEDEDE